MGRRDIHPIAARADRFAVATQLRELAELLQLDGADRFRARAYVRGAQAVENLTACAFEAMLRAKRLTDVAGIGPALARTIEELVAPEGSAKLAGLRTEYPPEVVDLTRVVSLDRARALNAALGVKSLADLSLACVAGRVRTVRGFGPKSEERLAARIEELLARPAHVLLPEAVRQADDLAEYLRRQPGVTCVEPAGAVRRRVETIGQLDLVVAADARAIKRTRNHPRALEVSQPARGEVVLQQAGRLAARVRVVPQRDFAAAWIDATGTPAHVAKLRALAAARGYTLTERALKRAGRRVPVSSEAELYARLGLPYVPAELREDAGELEAAASGSLPAALVHLEDVQGAVHCHTVYSDGKNSVEEMARAAEALGMRYLTITDHSAGATYAHGLDLERLHRQRDEIARVQERVAVRLLCGTESDILRDGGLDYPDAVLAQLDVVIASVHNRYRMDADQMTQRLLRALRHPLFKIWGHALGRYVLSRPPFECHMEEVLDAIAGARAAIEVNGDPNRLDMEPRWIRAARQRGIPFVISTDAHSVNGLRNLRWGVDMARRGWLQKSDVLNTLGPTEFAAAVHPLTA